MGRGGYKLVRGSPASFLLTILIWCLRKALACQLDEYPDARTFSASTWQALMVLWNQDCERNHEHKPWEFGDPASFSTTRARSTSPEKSTAAPPSTTRNFPRNFPVSPVKAVRFDTDAVASRFESWFEGRKRQPPGEDQLFYGVSGHNRVFQSWERAMVVLRETPGADLIFAHDEAGIHAFVREEAARMSKNPKHIT